VLVCVLTVAVSILVESKQVGCLFALVVGFFFRTPFRLKCSLGEDALRNFTKKRIRHNLQNRPCKPFDFYNRRRVQLILVLLGVIFFILLICVPLSVLSWSGRRW